MKTTIMAILFSLIVASVSIFAIWLIRKIKSFLKRRRERKDANESVLEKLCTEKEEFAARIEKSSKKLKLATKDENESIELQKTLLKEEKEIFTERSLLRRKEAYLPQKRGWANKNKYLILTSLFGAYLVAMCFFASCH